MAFVAGIHDPHTERRGQFVRRLMESLPAVVGNDWHQADLGDFSIVWSGRAPVSIAREPVQEARERLCVFFGGQSTVSPPTTPAESFSAALERGEPARSPLSADYCFGVRWDPTAGLTFAADCLGCFPVYYANPSDDIFLFSTSPLAARLHPAYRPAIDRVALAATLLIGHMVGRETIWSGVHRLAAGYRLDWSPRGGARERSYNPLVPHDTFFGASDDQCHRAIEEALEANCEGLRGRPAPAMLLSGGLDSRLLAGLLTAHQVSVSTALTLGDPLDIEFRCARRVARVSGLKHERISIDDASFARWADAQIRLEQGACSFRSLVWWAASEWLRAGECPAFVSGFLGDAILGGTHISDGLDTRSGEYGFSGIWSRMTVLGLTLEEVRSLVRDDRTLDAAVQRARAEFDHLTGEPFQRVWLFDLLNRQRYHTGAVVARLMLGSWPLMPFRSHRVLEVMAGMPQAATAGRRRQVRMVCDRFPLLARLPLDRNSLNTSPLLPRSGATTPGGKAEQFSREHWIKPGSEPRIYHRVHSLNHPGWQSVRKAAEVAGNGRIRDVLDGDALDRILPPPEQIVTTARPITETAGLKTLLGLAILFNQDLGLKNDET